MCLPPLRQRKASMAKAGTDPRKILLRLPNWLGDAVLCLPALERLRAHFPQAEIVALARPRAADLLLSHPSLNRVWVFERPGRHQGLRGLLALARELRQERFELAVLFQNAFEAALLVWLAGIPQRVGYRCDARGPLLTAAIAVPRPREIPAHETYYYLELLRRAGWLDSLPAIERVSLPPAPGLVERVRQRLRDSGAADKPLRVVIAPGVLNGSARCWPPERYAALADRLVEAHNAAVLLCGAPAEIPLGQEIRSRMRFPAISLMGQDTPAEMLCLLTFVDLFIGNDSGASHLAAAAGVPQVVIFGPTDETRTGPLNPRARIVKHAVSCQPCFLPQCPVDHRCLQRVSVDDVWQAVEAVLAERRAAVSPR